MQVKYAAKDALSIIDGELSNELQIHRFDDIKRSKAQLFATGGRHGRQFAIVLGNTNLSTGEHPAQQTRILLEKCVLPSLDGIQETFNPYMGSRIKSNLDSKISAPNQTSCVVSDETNLKKLLRWYSLRSL